MSAVREPTDRGATDDIQHAVSASADGMLVMDRTGVVLFANEAAEALFERPGQQLVGRDLGFPLEGTVELVVPSGERRHVELLPRNSRWGGDDAVVVSLRDVTGRVEAESVLRRALELRDDVVSLVAHDLRSPLAVIAGVLDVIGRIGELDAGQHEMADRARVQVWRMNRLIDNLLTFAQLESGQVAPDVADFSLAPAIDHMLAGLVDQRPTLDLDDGLVVHADASHVEEVLANFLTNATKYGAPPVTLTASTVGSAVEIRVSDCGKGVPEDFRDQLFTRFARRRKGAKGTGLGLAIARMLAEASGGEVWYEPREPTGATFVLRVPKGTGT